MSNQKVKSSDIKMSVLLKFLKDYYAEKGYPPNVREMGKAMGVKSTSTVVYYLKKLEQKGLIVREMAKTRAITYVKVDPDQVKKEETLVSMPLLGDIVAGYPLLSEENTSEVYYISKNLFGSTEELFCLTVKGESMIDAGMDEGDIVVVKVQNTAQTGDIVVARTEQGTTVKKFYRESNCVRLQPQNVAYMPIITKEVEIIGKVIGIIKKVR